VLQSARITWIEGNHEFRLRKYLSGISSQDARGIVQRPSGPKISTTEFYQVGTSHHLKRISLSTDVFLIDRSNEQVYIPDDGSFEFKDDLLFHGDGVDLKVAAAQELPRADERARGKILCEIRAVNRVELIVERQVGTEDLDGDKIVHSHARCGERGFDAVQEYVNLLLHVVGQFAGLGVVSDAPGNIQRIADQNGVAVRRLRGMGWKIDDAALGRSRG